MQLLAVMDTVLSIHLTSLRFDRLGVDVVVALQLTTGVRNETLCAVGGFL